MQRDSLILLRNEVERLHPASFDWALAICGFDRQDAQDVLQSAYLKLMEGKARWDGRSTVKTWFFAVIRRTADDRRRSLWRRALRLARWENSAEPSVPPTAELEIGRDQDRRRVRAALQTLSAKQREVLDLVFFHELTVEDAAAVMGVTLGTARVHYDRGKRGLLEELARP